MIPANLELLCVVIITVGFALNAGGIAFKVNSRTRFSPLVVMFLLLTWSS